MSVKSTIPSEWSEEAVIGSGLKTLTTNALDEVFTSDGHANCHSEDRINIDLVKDISSSNIVPLDGIESNIF